MALSFWASAAAAQTEAELEAARARFGEGVELSQQERWDEAAQAFREVLEVRRTAQVQYNLAYALSHTDAIAESARALDAVLADPEATEPLRADATTLLEGLEPRLGRLTVRVAGDEAGFEVLVDSEPWSLDQLGQAVRVEAGPHTVVLQHAGEVRQREDVGVAAGATEVVLLRTATIAIDEPPPRDDADDGGGSIVEQWWFWAIVGGAAVAVGIGIGIGVAVASDGSVQPIAGDLSPGVLTVTP